MGMRDRASEDDVIGARIGPRSLVEERERDPNQGSLFARPVEVRPVEAPKDMVRKNDRATSKTAAIAVDKKRSKLMVAILAAFRHHGPMTDEELEKLPEFAGKHAPSTVRKRRVDLLRRSDVYDTGRTRQSTWSTRGGVMTVWAAAVRSDSASEHKGVAR